MSESTFRSPLWNLFSYFLDVFHSAVFVPIRHRNLRKCASMVTMTTTAQYNGQYSVLQTITVSCSICIQTLTTPTFLSSSPGSFILFFFFFFLSSISSGGAGTAPRPSPPGRRINSIGSISLQHKRRDTVIP